VPKGASCCVQGQFYLRFASGIADLAQDIETVQKFMNKIGLFMRSCECKDSRII